MKNSRKLFIFLVFLLPVFGRCESDLPYKDCFKNFNLPGHKQLGRNIDRVLFTILRKIQLSPVNYASHFAGRGSNAIYGHAQCPMYINRSECYSCVLKAIRRIKKDCQSSAEVEIWYELCFLRYDSTNFFKQVVQGPVFGWSQKQSPVAHSLDFIKTVNSVMAEATMRAIAASTRYGGMESVNSENNVVVHGMVQCTGDLEPLECSNCLNSLVKGLRSNCGGGAYSDCIMFAPSCMSRYVGVNRT
ncbi:cysteine-rich repeat secretory protein 55-like [Phalaenopsis equestris]|uniref:cysteine-rich repeat secretory protein 55-like n=1 Tax=Phalaenopsis equestris TaxID=78828 RepID=UPI0009E2549B|nr:cysteine-rich repeat secretory protein 55-like [Phalaenopsis equestris]